MKKRWLFSFMFITACTLLSAQSNFLIGLLGGITQSQYVTPGGTETPIERVSFFSPNLGISFRHHFHDKFYWQTNLQYIQFGERVLQSDNLMWPSENDGNGNYVRNPDLPHRLEYQQKTDFLSLRAGLGYYLWRSEKFGLGLMPFAEADFFIKNKDEQRFVYDDGRIDSTSGLAYYGENTFRKANFSAGLALSLQAKLGSKFDFSLSPEAFYQLQSATVKTSPDTDTRRYFVLGLSAGIFYRL